MQIVNTYFDMYKDLWWKITNATFFKTTEIYQASLYAFNRFNELTKNAFIKTEIGTTYD